MTNISSNITPENILQQYETQGSLASSKNPFVAKTRGRQLEQIAASKAPNWIFKITPNTQDSYHINEQDMKIAANAIIDEIKKNVSTKSLANSEIKKALASFFFLIGHSDLSDKAKKSLMETCVEGITQALDRQVKTFKDATKPQKGLSHKLIEDANKAVFELSFSMKNLKAVATPTRTTIEMNFSKILSGLDKLQDVHQKSMVEKAEVKKTAKDVGNMVKTAEEALGNAQFQSILDSIPDSALKDPVKLEAWLDKQEKITNAKNEVAKFEKQIADKLKSDPELQEFVDTIPEEIRNRTVSSVLDDIQKILDQPKKTAQKEAPASKGSLHDELLKKASGFGKKSTKESVSKYETNTYQYLQNLHPSLRNLADANVLPKKSQREQFVKLFCKNIKEHVPSDLKLTQYSNFKTKLINQGLFDSKADTVVNFGHPQVCMILEKLLLHEVPVTSSEFNKQLVGISTIIEFLQSSNDFNDYLNESIESFIEDTIEDLKAPTSPKNQPQSTQQVETKTATTTEFKMAKPIFSDGIPVPPSPPLAPPAPSSEQLSSASKSSSKTSKASEDDNLTLQQQIEKRLSKLNKATVSTKPENKAQAQSTKQSVTDILLERMGRLNISNEEIDTTPNEDWE